MSATVDFFEDVKSEFVGELSGKLGIDLTFTLQERAKKISDAADQYAEGINDVTFTKDGKQNKNLNKFGNQYEESDVLLRNLAEAANNTNTVHKTADSIFKEKKQGAKLSKSVSDAGKYNDDSTDVVGIKNGRVLKSQNRQHKVIKNSADLGEERYLLNNAKLTVPPEDFDKHKKFWEKKIKGSTEEKRKARKVLKMLEKGRASKSSVSLDDSIIGDSIDLLAKDKKSAKKIKQSLIDIKLVTGSRAIQVTSEGASQTIESVNDSGKKIVVFAVMRCMEELKKYFNGESESLFGTIKIIFNDIRKKFSSALKSDLSSKVLNAVKDFILGFFKDIKQLVSKAGKAFKTVVKEVWDYVTGKTDNFAQVIINIAKVVSTIAVTALGFALDKWLSSNGVPSYLSMIISAMAVALANVSVFRLIDGVSQAVLKIVASRDLAKKRREEVEALCADVFPLLDESMSKLDTLIETEQKERKKIFSKSFKEIQSSLTLNKMDDICNSYKSLYLFLDKDIPFTNAEEFDSFMLDDSMSFKL